MQNEQLELFCINQLNHKDPNFEFLSSWNVSDYDDVPENPVTEMTDEKFQELGFPVSGSETDDVRDIVRSPTENVINNPFITFVSRKYIPIWIIKIQSTSLLF